MPTYCCLFNHYNANHTINTYVFDLLDYFTTIDCQTILISNSPVETKQGKSLLKERFTGTYMERENTGYDFGAWQYAINKGLIPEDTEYLFLLNDSVFGPLYDLNITVNKMLADPAIDFWGLTDCNQMKWHLQSYFLCFRRKVFKSSAFKNFFKQNFVSFTKTEVIQHGEISLSTTLLNAGFKGAAAVPYTEFTKGAKNPFLFKNPTQFYGYALIKEFKFPFIKKEFVFQNPENIDIPGGVLSMLSTETDYRVSNIQEAIIDKCSVNTTGRNGPVIDVICHMYYLNTAYNFIIELNRLKTYNCRFLFNISFSLYTDPYFIQTLTASFPNCFIIQACNVGKDIGGKLAMIDLCMQLEMKSDYTILLHDKQSPHTSFGETWRKKLFRITEPDKIPKVIELFESDPKTGIVATEEFILNEFDKATKKFACTSDEILQLFIKQYQLQSTNFDFVGGTMFWIRTSLLRDFFNRYDPLQIRSTLEKGNVLDHTHGTNTHAWERMLSWIATDANYKITGINE